MRFVILLSLLTALAAASPISSRQSPNTALVPINERFEASVPWIWRPKKTDFEQFEDESDGTAPTKTNGDTNAVITKRNNGPWHWQTSKVAEQTEDNEATSIDTVISKRNNGPWHWQTSKVSEQFKDGVDDDVAIE